MEPFLEVLDVPAKLSLGSMERTIKFPPEQHQLEQYGIVVQGDDPPKEAH